MTERVIMKFNNVYEEEYYFPYQNMSLEDARFFRDMLSNTAEFMNGKIVQMGLIKNNDGVCANGLFAGYNGNKAFNCTIVELDNGYKVYALIRNLSENKDYNMDCFVLCNKNNRNSYIFHK